ncbi:MAG: SigE family RNA polymerase sigma factor [Actinomycetota bacterium]|jgi:DNA-directed RNA polymerase specialized sigma24 family protein|nr:SigE family RNA polymerase sigma factor [Actinomycetota bacterium]
MEAVESLPTEGTAEESDESWASCKTPDQWWPQPRWSRTLSRSRPPHRSRRPSRIRTREKTTADPEVDDECAKVSFETFYLASYEGLVRLAYVLTSSRELAEDLVQDCFVRMHQRFGEVEQPERYMRRSIVNAARSHYRSSGRERDKQPFLYVLPGGGGVPGASGELNDVLLGLPYRQRAAVVLRFYSDLSEDEIAEVLGCRPGTVGSLIHRALGRMRKEIDR